MNTPLNTAAQTVIVWGPQGCGKTTQAPTLQRQYGCLGIVDEWFPGTGLKPGHLHLTSEHPGPGQAPRGVLVVEMALAGVIRQ